MEVNPLIQGSTRLSNLVNGIHAGGIDNKNNLLRRWVILQISPLELLTSCDNKPATEEDAGDVHSHGYSARARVSIYVIDLVSIDRRRRDELRYARKAWFRRDSCY